MKIPPEPPLVQDVFSQRFDALQEALSDERYWQFSRNAEQSYRHWDKVRFMARKEGLDPELAWVFIKIGRQQQYRPLPLIGHGGTSLCYSVPDRIQRELMLIDQELAGRISSMEEHPFAPGEKDQFIIRSFQEEAIASSMLEGAVTTRRVAREMLRTGRKPRDRGERMVVNNYNAISFIREHLKTPLTPDFLIELQEMLTRDTLDDPDQCGRLRRADDHVEVVDPYGQVIHTPPPAEGLSDRLKSLCSFANRKSEKHGFIHPVLKACVLHFQIGFDHPFCDGNGRTARAVFYWSMLQSGYWLFEFLPISRLIYRSPGKYAKAFLYAETDDFDLTYFFNYSTRVIALGRKELKEYLARKQKEMSEAQARFDDDGQLNFRQRDTLIRMRRNPSMSLFIGDHQGRYGVAYGTARSDLLGLETLGYLKKRKLGRTFEFVKGPKLNSPEDDS